MAARRTNSTTEDAAPSGERDPGVRPRGGERLADTHWSSLTQQQLPGTLISTS